MASQPIHAAWRFLAVIIVLLAADQPGEAAKKIMERGPRTFTFKIDAATPVKDLLPAPPKTPPKLPPVLGADLSQTPEVALGDFVPKSKKEADFEEAAAFQIAKINHLNGGNPDAFVKALQAHRPDLRGLPFLMGKACRTEGDSALVFAETAAIVRRQLDVIASRDPEAASVPNAAYTEKLVWGDFPQVLNDKGDAKGKRHQASQADLDRAALAAMTQMLPVKPALYRVCFAKHLSTMQERGATEALARLALFAPEESVRHAAVAGLANRPAKDYAPILVQALRYPFPAVSQRAADALVKLRCKDMLADLVAVLEEPDPRAPRKQAIDGKEATVIRELVRVHHHRNCLLCHPPANTKDVPKGVLTAPVTLPAQSVARGYGFGGQSPDTFVRIDVTYLRQDFSLLDGKDRFDYFVRTRTLSAEETAEYTKQLAQQGTPPSHRAAQHALRQLTGQTPAEATPEAWRRLLKL